jgi:hypothetical protein
MTLAFSLGDGVSGGRTDERTRRPHCGVASGVSAIAGVARIIGLIAPRRATALASPAKVTPVVQDKATRCRRRAGRRSPERPREASVPWNARGRERADSAEIGTFQASNRRPVASAGADLRGSLSRELQAIPTSFGMGRECGP